METAALRVPTGTVTFLFSDVVGSTRLWAKDPDAMAASLRIHDQIFTETIAKHHGYVFATAGDSFAAAFERSTAAVECAQAIAEALGQVEWGMWPELEVRMGLHLGEAEERGGNYFARWSTRRPGSWPWPMGVSAFSPTGSVTPAVR